MIECVKKTYWIERVGRVISKREQMVDSKEGIIKRNKISTINCIDCRALC